MNRATVLTSWGQYNGHDAPQIAIDYLGQLTRCDDITEQSSGVPDPNLYSVVIECDDATLALIESDTNYHVITSEVIDEDPQ
ncbi:MAG: hypothetical protein ACN4GR_17335 [Arenicellales bacterium]